MKHNNTSLLSYRTAQFCCSPLYHNVNGSVYRQTKNKLIKKKTCFWQKSSSDSSTNLSNALLLFKHQKLFVTSTTKLNTAQIRGPNVHCHSKEPLQRVFFFVMYDIPHVQCIHQLYCPRVIITFVNYANDLKLFHSEFWRARTTIWLWETP